MSPTTSVPTMGDYHAIQLTGSKCGGKNCACASAADAIYFGSGGRTRLTADQVRAESGKSCVPGVDTPSGGIYIGDVERVCAAHDVDIDYGRDPQSFYERWEPAAAKARLGLSWGAIFLGDYDQMVAPYRQPGSTFLGDHSAWGHDYRTDLPAHPGGPRDAEPTICWHDPLRSSPIRLPWNALLAYWQKDSSPIRGFAGFVKIPPPPGVPAALGPKPSAATMWVETSRLARLFKSDRNGVLERVKGPGVLYPIDADDPGEFTFTAWAGQNVSRVWKPGPKSKRRDVAIFRPVLGPPHKGLFIRVTDQGCTWHHL